MGVAGYHRRWLGGWGHTAQSVNGSASLTDCTAGLSEAPQLVTGMGALVTPTSARDLFGDCCEGPPTRVTESSTAFREKTETTRIPVDAEQGDEEDTAIDDPAEFTMRCALKYCNALLSILLGLEKEVACQYAFRASPRRLVDLCRATWEHKAITMVR